MINNTQGTYKIHSSVVVWGGGGGRGEFYLKHLVKALGAKWRDTMCRWNAPIDVFSRTGHCVVMRDGLQQMLADSGVLASGTANQAEILIELYTPYDVLHGWLLKHFILVWKSKKELPPEVSNFYIFFDLILKMWLNSLHPFLALKIN